MAKKHEKRLPKGKHTEKEEVPAWKLARDQVDKGTLGYLRGYVSVTDRETLAADSWAYVTSGGTIYLNPRREATVGEWEYVICHCLLHLGFGHFQQERMEDRNWHNACDCVVTKFLRENHIGSEPIDFRQELPSQVRSEEQVWGNLCSGNEPRPSLSVAGKHLDMVWREERYQSDYPEIFAESLQFAMGNALRAAQGLPPSEDDGATIRFREGYTLAKEWFLTNYPLLGAVASSFRIVDDRASVRRMEIPVAAVSAQLGEIYVNPACELSRAEWRFVLAHEYLHAALRHDLRCEDRDPELWNEACDYVINGWLTEMGVGEMPEFCLLDQRFQGLSAEGVYDLLLEDIRYYQKKNPGDVLYGDAAWWDTLEGEELDRMYRSALRQGLLHEQSQGRGAVPAGLVEEIRALARPPIHWDVELGKWFDLRFPMEERHRTYARMSRRQSAAPDIPRPGWYNREHSEDQRTFGVLLDTSGSMDRHLLAAALGSIISYAQARNVKRVRVVFCDAAPYDQGYMDVADIAEAVQIRGRGGTRLQPGIQLLEEARDFPKSAPLLIITDGFCDRLNLRGREHAYLIPWGNRLPFPPKGPVFKLK